MSAASDSRLDGVEQADPRSDEGLAEYIRRLVDAAPVPLSPAQRDRLAVLLHGIGS